MFRGIPRKASSEAEQFQAFDPSKIITKLALARMAEDEAYQEEREAQRLAYLAEEARIWDSFLRYCQPATAKDYAAWLKGYIYHNPDSSKLRYLNNCLEEPMTTASFSIGPEGVIEHEDPSADVITIPKSKYWILNNLDHVYIPEADGGSSFAVIIPVDAKLTPEMVRTNQVGHNTFYFMGDYSTNSPWVNIYQDVAEVFDQA